MIAGISTACLYPEHTEIALRRLCKYSVKAVEVFINSLEELSGARLREMRKIADYYGVQILSVHPYTSGMEPMYFFSAYDRRFKEGAKFYKKYYQAANTLGADIVVFHGNIYKSPMEQELYFNRFGRLVDEALAEGVSLCHENVSRCVGRSPAFFKALRAYVPKAEFVLDTKQAVRSGEDVMAFVSAMGNRIKHIHISDFDAGNDCLAPGKGIFNIRDFLLNIKKFGFNEGVIVELYRENYGEVVELFDSYQLLCAQLSTL